MSRVTRFAGRDPGPAARMSGFLAHLRENGLRLGVAETDLALVGLSHVSAAHIQETRAALKAICTGCKEDAARFDDLFAAYWLNTGRVKPKVISAQKPSHADQMSSSRRAAGTDQGASGAPDTPETGENEADSDGVGRLIASKTNNLKRADLRALIQPSDLAKAQELAEKLGTALKDRRARRRRAAQKGLNCIFAKLSVKALQRAASQSGLPEKTAPNAA